VRTIAILGKVFENEKAAEFLGLLAEEDKAQAPQLRMEHQRTR
jgi:hypothetical protein